MSENTIDSEQIDIDKYIDEIFESVEYSITARSEMRGILRALIAEAQGEVSPLNTRVSDNRRWKDVREELPERGEQVLVHADDIPIAMGYLIFDESGYKNVWSVDYGCMDSRRKNITHWHPLPKTPE